MTVAVRREHGASPRGSRTVWSRTEVHMCAQGGICGQIRTKVLGSERVRVNTPLREKGPHRGESSGTAAPRTGDTPGVRGTGTVIRPLPKGRFEVTSGYRAPGRGLSRVPLGQDKGESPEREVANDGD